MSRSEAWGTKIYARLGRLGKYVSGKESGRYTQTYESIDAEGNYVTKTVQKKKRGKGASYNLFYIKDGRYYKNYKNIERLHNELFSDEGLKPEEILTIQEKNAIWAELKDEIERIAANMEDGIYRTQGQWVTNRDDFSVFKIEKGLNRIDVASLLSRIQDNRQVKFITNLGYTVDELVDVINERFGLNITAEDLLNNNRWNDTTFMINGTQGINMSFTYDANALKLVKGVTFGQKAGIK